MTDRVHPSSKPAVAGANGATSSNPAPAKSQLYNPTRPMFRPSQYNRRRRSGRSGCCCCCFWSVIVLLAVVLLAAIVGAVLYVLYRPHRPQFSITNLRIARMKLATSTDSSSHLSSLLNLTLIANNPNNHLVFSYEPFTVTAFYDSVPIGNGSIPAFTSDKNNQSSLRAVLSDSRDLDTDSLTSLRSGLKKSNGFPVVIQMDTKVKLKMEWLKSKRVGIRVTCDGINGKVPAGKTPSVASVTDSVCKVDLRIKIWKFSF
ncbi:NDR1/HIN1-like protein 13 [Prosopis cineraria]|uniref:NDR1/HIN1-like protein 13 n=1 Tax=Prosopis cineraria TaxID=364024 RepID=UPI0024103574|nr:NDR1/HIN1-like protein 13 [Prosopis cineraria]